MFLKKGDLIDVVAPSAMYDDLTIDKLYKFADKLGFKVRVAEEMQQKGADPFSANSLNVRLKTLTEALLSKDSSAVWCLRGGYGASKLIPELDKIDFSLVSKPIIGFSDITALHIYFNQKYNLKTIHGRTISEYLHKKVLEEEIKKMQQMLQGSFYNQVLAPANKLAKDSLSLKAQITGGNLVLVEQSIGTNWQIKPQNKILLLEDVAERGYRVDRSLNHLKQAGIFDAVLAVILGDFSCAPEPNGEFKCELALEEFIEQAKFPIFRTSDFGHGKVNNPIIFGLDYAISIGEEVLLSVDYHD